MAKEKKPKISDWEENFNRLLNDPKLNPEVRKAKKKQ